MPLDDITIISLIVAIASILVAGLTVFFVRGRLQTLKEVRNSVDTYAIVKEFAERIRGMEQRIVDLRVRLEIMELRQQQNKTAQISRQELEQADESPSMEPNLSVVEKDHGSDPSIADFEKRVLEIVLEKHTVSARDIQVISGKSREHTARMMNELFKRRLLIRDSAVRPFQYSLSENGKMILDRTS